MIGVDSKLVEILEVMNFLFKSFVTSSFACHDSFEKSTMVHYTTNGRRLQLHQCMSNPSAIYG